MSTGCAAGYPTTDGELRSSAQTEVYATPSADWCPSRLSFIAAIHIADVNSLAAKKDLYGGTEILGVPGLYFLAGTDRGAEFVRH
jgi:hypothetical protein